MPEPSDTTGRFARFQSVEWWDQSRLRNAKVLVVGAGALGNEVLKNLALLGIGSLVVVDRDHVERSNLCRSVLFRESDEGQPKAECAARALRQIYPEIQSMPIVGNVLADVGFGLFRWADIVVGALDNREARVFVNAACARLGRPWLDGGIEMLQGIVRGFAPPHTACYECTMSETDWQLLNQQRSCLRLARRAAQHGGTPTSPTTASVVGAMQAQEVVKILHGMDALLGKGFVFEGLAHNSYTVEYAIKPDCGWHTAAAPVVALADVGLDTPLASVWNRATSELGAVDALDLGRELVERLVCPGCGSARDVWQSADRISAEQAQCGVCGAACAPVLRHAFGCRHELNGRTARSIGLPSREIVWARRGAQCIGFELAGDKYPGGIA